MIHLIAFLIEGEAAEWHRKVSIDIAQKFGTWDIYDRVPPHVTLYKPFETENTEDIKMFIRSFLSSHPLRGNFILSGFDRFDDKVIFADMKPDPIALEIVTSFRTLFSGIQTNGAEYYPDNWHPHATLVRLVAPELIEEAWKYVNTLEKPVFDLLFNNITLFRSLGNKSWEVEEKFF